ncbi:PP272 [Orf virus]|uniref:PP272 n=1 Tax=Orf virus TaxID=10258 RepID=F1AXH2_ORFV|nr:PP272 [Orf virus]
MENNDGNERNNEHPHVREFKEASLYGFLAAAADVTVEDVHRYLQFGADVNYRGAYLCTPLHAYLQSGCEKHLDVVDALLDAGADINAKEICGLTPVHLYASYADVDVAFMRGLVERGASVCGESSVTGCLYSYLYTHSVDGGARLDVVELLVQAGADVNVRGEARKTPLHVHCAGFQVDSDIVKLLLRSGADPEALDEHGLTPADVLVKSVGANVATLRLFLDAGVSVATSRDARGRTPLHHHADSFRASAGIVRELLAAGCDAAAADDLGNTPLHSLGHLLLVPALGARPAHRRRRGHQRSQPLRPHLSVLRVHLQPLRLLAAHRRGCGRDRAHAGRTHAALGHDHAQAHARRARRPGDAASRGRRRCVAGRRGTARAHGRHSRVRAVRGALRRHALGARAVATRGLRARVRERGGRAQNHRGGAARHLAAGHRACGAAAAGTAPPARAPRAAEAARVRGLGGRAAARDAAQDQPRGRGVAARVSVRAAAGGGARHPRARADRQPAAHVDPRRSAGLAFPSLA